jgi:hypothetical protein
LPARADTELLTTADGLLERVRAHFDVQAMHLALEAIWLMLGAADGCVPSPQPQSSERNGLRLAWLAGATARAVGGWANCRATSQESLAGRRASCSFYLLSTGI